MVETRPFKTKLCVLYERGRCGRKTCTFAHGDAELRPYSGFLPERRSDRGNDLRNKLDRKRSSLQYSPRRDSHSFRRFSPPLSAKRRSYRSYEHADGQSDLPRTFNSEDETPDRTKDKQLMLSESRRMVEDEWKQVKYEVDVLLEEKSQLKIELKERSQEADSFSSRIRDLEVQLSEEKVKFKRVNSKVGMVIRAHGHHSRLQDKIKRSELQLEQLVKELGMGGTHIDASEDNLNVDIISDEEFHGSKDHACHKERPLPSRLEVPQGSNSGSLHLPIVSPDDTVKGHVIRDEANGRSLLSRLDENRAVEVGDKREVTARLSSESKPRRRKDAVKRNGSSDADGLQLKVSESNRVAPLTSMAANATDDFVEQDTDESMEADETASAIQSGLSFPIPPLPPVAKNSYFQFEDEDEDVNVDDLDLL